MKQTTETELKIEKAINSCVSLKQLAVCRKMAGNYFDQSILGWEHKWKGHRIFFNANKMANYFFDLIDEREKNFKNGISVNKGELCPTSEK